MLPYYPFEELLLSEVFNVVTTTLRNQSQQLLLLSLRQTLPCLDCVLLHKLEGKLQLELQLSQ